MENIDSNKAKYVYSGKCREGTLGVETNLYDAAGERLYVGDIVIASSTDQFGISYNSGLTVVVSDEVQTTLNLQIGELEHIPKNGDTEFYVMGIRNTDFMSEDSEWSVKRVKSYKDVVNGEKWPDYGFNYRND